MVKNDTNLEFHCPGHVFIGTFESKSISSCVGAVIGNPDCTDSFFYSLRHGYCKCEKYGTSCLRNEDINYNEYRLVGGIICVISNNSCITKIAPIF